MLRRSIIAANGRRRRAPSSPSWDVSNLFVMGGAVFPQNAGHNPTATIAALTYWSAKAITEQYLKSPGPLVRA
jgi:gluconate 2-dehydrogenase alpha chain